MDQAQQTALEEVVGRTLTQAEITELTPLVAARNDVAITEMLSVGREKFHSKPVGSGTILDVMGNGGQFLDLLVQIGGGTDTLSRQIYWSMDLIKQGRFDIGVEKAQAQLAGLAQMRPEFAQGIAALCALGRMSDPLPVDVVSKKLNIAEGRLTL